MNISYNWLKEYVNFDLTPDEDGQQPNHKDNFPPSNGIGKLHYALLCVEIGNRIV